jgi:hypothetical protein
MCHFQINLKKGFANMKCFQLPRAATSVTRTTAVRRTPLGSSFVRFNSNGGEEKVKGQVIGIDLGK